MISGKIIPGSVQQAVCDISQGSQLFLHGEGLRYPMVISLGISATELVRELKRRIRVGIQDEKV